LVSAIPQMAEREGPLLVFRDFVADPDLELEQHIRLQLGQRTEMLDLIRKKIGFEKKVRLSVEDIQVRLMFVPQLQEDHADAYHRYCRDITDYLFEMNEMDNCYAAIASPNESYPPLSQTGISAFLVHRLAKDYRAVCRFTAESVCGAASGGRVDGRGRVGGGRIGESTTGALLHPAPNGDTGLHPRFGSAIAVPSSIPIPGPGYSTGIEPWIPGGLGTVYGKSVQFQGSAVRWTGCMIRVEPAGKVG